MFCDFPAHRTQSHTDFVEPKLPGDDVDTRSPDATAPSYQNVRNSC